MTLKILCVSEYFPPKIFGGGEILAELLVKNLATKGIEVSVLTSYFTGLKKYEEDCGVKIYRRLRTGEDIGGFISNLKRAFIFPNSTKDEIIKLNKAENFDLIHCMNINSIIGAVKANEEIKKPIIAEANAPILFCPLGTLLKGEIACTEEVCNFQKFFQCFLKFGKISKVKERWYLRYNPFFILYVYYRFKNRKNTIKKINFLIAVSKFMKNLLIKEGVPEERIAVVPNLVEIENFSDLKFKEHKIPRILYVGVYEKFKGPQILLNALKNLEGEFRCNFYGSGSLKEELNTLVKKLNLKDKVKINDFVEYSKIQRLYQEHDIVVFPSIWPEIFGRIAIESMAAGKPVIASRIGGVIDIIKNNQNGLLVEPGNIEELTKALEELIQNPRLREKLGQKGREMAKKYSGEKIANGIIDVYNSTLSDFFP